MRRKRVLPSALALSLLAALVAAMPAGAALGKSAGSNSGQERAVRYATTNLRQLARVARPAKAAVGNQVPKLREHVVPKARPNREPLPPPIPGDTPITSKNPPDFFANDGLDHADSRLSNNGNHYSEEPPDQALCQGNGFTFEAINTALQVYDSASGAVLTPPIDHNAFFGLPPAIDRTKTPSTFPGPFLGDAQCEFDWSTGHWLFLSWGIAQDKKTGNITGPNHYYIAASKTDDPTGDWFLYKINADSPGHPGCPCAGDHPMIGFDQNVFVVTDNEFPWFTPGFNGDQIRIMSKAALESGGPSPVIHRQAGNLGGGLLYTLQPAVPPPGGSFETAQGGTLYFLSALDYFNEGDNRIAVEALTNTSSIDTSPALGFQKITIPSEVYIIPKKMVQRPGPIPLGDSVGEPLRKLDGGSDETQPTKFAAGDLWTIIDTQVGGENLMRNGLAYFRVHPSFAGSKLTAHVVNEGYAAVRHASLTYGSIAVTASGKALIAMSMVGPSTFPTTTYGFLNPARGLDAVHIAGAGIRPEDGFTCYKAFVGGGPGGVGRGCRWGDYSDANVGTDGNFWFASEYITPRARTLLANWGTYVGSVGPHS